MPRILLYSHDTLGLGHLRRCLALAAGFTRRIPDAAVLIVSGSRAAGSYTLPPRVDMLTLPSLHKRGNGDYVSRSLDGDAAEIRALRSGILRATVKVFAPQIIYVDKEPLGPLGELREVLEDNLALRERGAGAATLLGLRDILDAPDAVHAEWASRGTLESIRRYYDQVVVYGMREIYDLAVQYRLDPALAARLCYAGYIDPRERDSLERWSAAKAGDSIRIAVTAGGGEDGLFVFTSYLRAARRLEQTHRLESTLVLGPDFPERAVESVELLAGELSHPVYIVRFAEDMSHYIRQADLVVSMGGYNTVSEICAYAKRAVLVPRVEPRLEQLLRAERLAERGLVSYADPRTLTDESFARVLSSALESPAPPSTGGVLDMRGLECTAALVEELLGSRAVSHAR